MSSIAKKLMIASGTSGEDNWIALLAGSGNDQGLGVLSDSSGNIVVGGTTGSVGAGGNDILVAKYNSAGDLIFARTLGGAGTDSLSRIAVDSQDNIIGIGSTNSAGAGLFDAVLFKYNASGVLQFAKTIGHSGQDFGTGVAVDSQDNILIAIDSRPGNIPTGIVAKLNGSGVLQWMRQVTTFQAALVARNIVADNQDNVISIFNVPAPNQSDMLILKHNSSGTLQFQRSLGRASADNARGVAIDSNNDIIVSGSFNTIDGVGAGSFDAVVAKISSAGSLQFVNMFGTSVGEFGRSVALDTDNNILFCGASNTDGAGGQGLEKVLLISYTSAGVLVYSNLLGTSGGDAAGQASFHPDGSILVSGSMAIGNGSVLTAKLPADGSKTGTYGSITYQPVVLSGGFISATFSTSPNISVSSTSLTENFVTLVDAAAVLTETFFDL